MEKERGIRERTSMKVDATRVEADALRFSNEANTQLTSRREAKARTRSPPRDRFFNHLRFRWLRWRGFNHQAATANKRRGKVVLDGTTAVDACGVVALLAVSQGQARSFVLVAPAVDSRRRRSTLRL